MKSSLVIDGKDVPVGPDISIRFYIGNDGVQPTLFNNGKRITKSWKLQMQAEQEDCQHEGNANTA